jgi:ribosomal protein S27AE
LKKCFNLRGKGKTMASRCLQAYISAKWKALISVQRMECRRQWMNIPKKGGDILPHTGETPEKGEYKCKNCGKQLTLDEEKDRLPPCPECHKTEFEVA